MQQLDVTQPHRALRAIGRGGIDGSHAGRKVEPPAERARIGDPEPSQIAAADSGL